MASQDDVNQRWWKLLKKEVRRRDRDRCRICGIRQRTLFSKTEGMVYNARYLVMAHIRPRRTHPELAQDIRNVLLLCPICDRKYGERLWEPQIAELYKKVLVDGVLVSRVLTADGRIKAPEPYWNH